MAKSTMGVRLGEETQSRLEALGRARDRSPHYLMKAAIERFLDVEEALEEERLLVTSRWEKYKLTGETLDHADVKAWADGLDDSLSSDPESGDTKADSA
ncbi:CopG family ribbon-helix-helix protein [Denitrobaculum tricleocarpae]|uniref:Toxin-antitoxin system n=1 Tax=Denitrobaculum tricleocarpae TaxID=2591009 RepID=A0A545TTI8_9PROT|nr:toxin-antitoxin system [Denitrobaculum tricleocarpae]TQV80528.1 toxin-antitoxin system [Denitrobaculum tricleocarpae]